MDLFVGRSAEISAALDLLLDADEGSVLDITGIRGIGKTYFLRKLLERARAVDGVVVRSIDLMSEGIGKGHRKQGNDAGRNVFSDTYLQASRLMAKVIEGYERDFKLFRLKLLEPVPPPGLETGPGGGNAISLGRGSAVGPISMSTSVHVDESALSDHFHRLQARLDDAFVEAWRTFTLRRRLLIAVDSAELIANEEIGAWLLRIALRLPRTLVVTARVPLLHDFGPPSDRLFRQELPNLTEDEVRRYLVARMVGEELAPRVPRVVHAFTEGHPYGVALTAELIDEVGPPAMDASRLRRLLARVPDDSTKWGALISTLLDEVSNPLLTRAVAAAAVVRRFDEPMLAYLMSGSDDADRAVDDVSVAMRALRVYRLAQPVLSVSGRSSRWSRLHEFVRLAVNNRLRHDQWREWQRLHQRAADYCFRWLEEWSDGENGPYCSWYRYEDPEWQAYEREWLYHSGFVTRRPHLARARFTQVFLEAFYWWGCYRPFAFNRQLIEDWEVATGSWSSDVPGSSPGQPTPEQRLADALVFLLENYPPGGIKPPTARWDEIRATLLLVKELCGLGNTRNLLTAEEAAELRRVDALINVFLAHTRRYRDPADPVGQRYYQQAQGGFQELDDPYMLAWLQRERAEHALERGDRAGAENHWRVAVQDALRLAQDDPWDHELAGDLYRLAADLDWVAGATQAAAVGYGRAVAEAYWYQDRPHLPDEYTQAYYQELTGRAVDRILEFARQSGIDTALRLAAVVWEQVPGELGSEMPKEVADALARGDRLALGALLFPAGPATADLHADDSAFLRRWRLHWDDDPQDLAGRLAALLAERTVE